MPYLAKMLIYPIKSLDGVEVEQRRVLASGALENDREFAIFDENSQVVNGKRHSSIHKLRSPTAGRSPSHFSIPHRTISLQLPGQASKHIFHLDKERQALTTVLSDFFGFAVTLQQNSLVGFPDDLESTGPTVISTATLQEVASWFPGVTVEEMRRRMRANLEIDGVPAFWEDQLFTASGDMVAFRIGDVQFLGVNPCQRCIVPTRDSLSGDAYPSFQKIFIQKRQATLPEWVASSRFNHFYRLSINTKLPKSEAGKIIRTGDKVEILTSDA
ncbi:MOSC domain-containing protein [Anabaena azotica]|uniref:MOSC N-terminal beta barrel domain-containing protein n=1 Tax=Anabaena azotica FACHB-119 TaxID=947527 RepID=A0ABR8D7L7_9NOST|nr:MOSC N-terminal beta barrel domain-containing protein [Anabaena azotica]MBD2502423.1 MOSC N-terminal beta barrel domain-containing protein [Anabaena azotica FACHB-119]